MDHDAVVEDWKQNAENRAEENQQFLRSTKFQDYDFDPDDLAGQLHEEAFQIVDCARCANCCKKMDVNFDDEDIERIAGHLNAPVDKFIEMYLEADDEDGPFKAPQKPCPFLAEDNRCTIYDARPCGLPGVREYRRRHSSTSQADATKTGIRNASHALLR
jgi:hypothetical protein